VARHHLFLAEKPLGINELAGTVDADPDALSRLLRALIGRASSVNAATAAMT
jgi:predicted transcriptional regulator